MLLSAILDAVTALLAIPAVIAKGGDDDKPGGDAVSCAPGPPAPYPPGLPLDISPNQNVVQIPPSITGVTYSCPSNTRQALTIDQLQVAMNDFAYIFYTLKDPGKALKRYAALEYGQHNPSIGDGRTAAINGLTGLFNDPTTSFQVGCAPTQNTCLKPDQLINISKDCTCHGRTRVHDHSYSSHLCGGSSNDPLRCVSYTRILHS